MSADTIQVRINGRPESVPSGLSVTTLLAHLGFGQTPMLVEHNGLALFPRDFPSTPVGEGDTLELIRVVAGG